MVVYALVVRIAQPVSLVLVLLLLRLVHADHNLLHHHHHHRHHHHLTICHQKQIVEDMAEVYVHPDIVKNSVQLLLINAVHQFMELRMEHIAQTYEIMIHV